MADSLELPSLYVEGDTDLHTIVHLLARHKIALDKALGPVLIKKAQNDRGVLDTMTMAARASTNRPVGFVVDADLAVAHRWHAVRDRLKDLDLTLPATAPVEGFIGEATAFRTKVGVWIMPDNVMDQGTLEHLVKTLVPPDDTLIAHANSATDQALSLGAAFPAQDRLKAELYCWLAWQREPGMSFGMALKARFFRHDSDVALRFVAWFKALYEL